MTPPRPLTADLLLEHSGFLHGLARSLVLDEQRAEDVVQETFMAALQRPPPPHVRLRAWLGAVTRNLALRARRTEGRVQRREQHAAHPEGGAATADVAARVEVQRRIAEAVAGLDEPGRSAIVWRYFDGLPPREIARREGVSVRTIESRLRRARGTLRARLDAEYGGSRGLWCAVLLPSLGLEIPTATSSSAAGATAASTTSGTTGAAGGLTAAAAVGATLVSTKLIIGAAAACVAGAFFAGRQLPSTISDDSAGEVAQAPVVVADDAPQLRADAEQVIGRMRDTLAATNKKLAAAEHANTDLQAQLDEARAAGFLTVAEKAAAAAAADEGLYAPEKYKKAVADVTWPEAGEAAAKMVPLLHDIAEAFAGRGELDPKVGLEIFKWNQQLQKVAVAAIAADVPGGASNSAFSHPSVTINLIVAALDKAGVPADEQQQARLREYGDRFIEQDERRMAGYNDETFKLQQLIDECALKDNMFADIDAVLQPKQRDVLHPESVRQRMGIDLFSSGTIWYALGQAVDFKTREDLSEALVKLYEARGNISEQELTLVRSAAKEWSQSLSEAFLQASADPLAQTSRRKAANGMMAGWQRLTQVRTAAAAQLALNKALFELFGPDSKQAGMVRGDTRVYIPLMLPTN